MNPHQDALREAQQQIFNKLCAAFRRSREKPEFRLLLENVRSELNLPGKVFSEALENFSDAGGKCIVTLIDQNGDRYITLGESAKSNVSDWVESRRGSVALSVQRHIANLGSLQSIDSMTLKQLLRINHNLMRVCLWLNERGDLEISSRLIPIVDELNLLLSATATDTLQ